MSRCGKHRRIISTSLILGWLLVLATPALSNIRFYSIVQQICTSYRVSVDLSQMSLDGVETDHTVFQLMLKSRRNNFEEVMMIGYIAAGQAIARTGIVVHTINVIVTIPKADNLLIMTSASIDLVEQLRTGKIKSSEFRRQIQWT